jgi:hypothetical protein
MAWVKCKLHNDSKHIIINLDQVETMRADTQGSYTYTELQFSSGRKVEVADLALEVLQAAGYDLRKR